MRVVFLWKCCRVPYECIIRVHLEAVDGHFKSYHIWVMRLPFHLVIDNTRYAQAISSMFALGGRAGYGIITIFGHPLSLYVYRAPEVGRKAAYSI